VSKRNTGIAVIEDMRFSGYPVIAREDARALCVDEYGALSCGDDDRFLVLDPFWTPFTYSVFLVDICIYGVFVACIGNQGV
jgi:hypothetical protein